MSEDERQAFHVFLGFASMGLVYLLGVQLAAYVVGVILVCGLALAQLKLSGHPLGAVDRLIERFERPHSTVGYGAMAIAAGTLCILTFLHSPAQIYASLCMLGLGDAASTYFGRRGTRKLPYNRRKTVEGSIAFLVFSLPAVYFVGWIGIVVAALAAFAEGVETKIDDNLLVPLVCVLAFRLLLG